MANKAFGVSNINATGSVGIGTDNPLVPLHISGTNGILIDDSTNGKRLDLRSKNDIVELNAYDPINSNAAVPIVFKHYTTEVARFNTSGNLAFPSGKGIDFSATANGSGTTNSELFDDYEEGTFTPEFASAAAGGTESSSYATQDGRYTKIGNLVHIDIYLKNVVTTSLGTSQFFIRGLPFAIKSGSIYIGAAGLSQVDLNSTASSLYSFANATNSALTAIRVFQTKDNTTHSAVPCDSVNSGSNEIFITMTYPTDS